MKSFAGSITALFVAGMVGGYAGLCLLGPTDESQTAVAAARVPDPPALPCSMQAWPNADRKCLEWTAPRAEAASVAATDGSQKVGAAAPSLDKRATAAAPPSTVGMGVANRQTPAAVPQPAAEAARDAASETAPPADQPAKAPASKSQQAARARSKAAAVVHRFDDNLNGVPVNAYAYEGGSRRSGVRSSASQDRYYGARTRGWWW
jgi:cytoskeletal protein RodZ